MSDLIRGLAVIVLIPIIIAIAQCGKAGCNTVVYPAKSYQGAVAVYPYLELGKMETRIWRCDGFTCAVSIVVKPWLHNPLARDVMATISCTYWNNGQEIDRRKLKPVLVPARSSTLVEVHHGTNILRECSTIGLDCDADFAQPTGVKFSSHYSGYVAISLELDRDAAP